MKNKNTLYIFFTAYLALLIQTPGRFVYGTTLMIELILLVTIGTLINSLIKKIQMEEIASLILLTTLIAFTILFRQILVILYSEIALTLGYILYFPTVSIFFLNNIFTGKDFTLPVRLVRNLKSTLIFSIVGLMFFLFRDITGFGTFTFFGKNHNIYEKLILNSDKIGIFSFVASIPGALTLSGLLLFILVLVNQKVKIIKNMELQIWYI